MFGKTERVTLFIYYLNYFQLCWVFIATHWLSLVAVSRGYSLVVVMNFLCSSLSFCGAQVLSTVGFSSYSTWAQQFQLMGSRVLAQQLQSMGLVNLPQWDKGLNLCSLNCKVDSLPLSHQGSCPVSYFTSNRYSITGTDKNIN